MTIEERTLKPYIALGPIMERGWWDSVACAYEPPEKYRPYVEVMAPNVRVARKLALADPQFDDIGETSDTVPWKYVRVIQYPHNPPPHACVGEEFNGEVDEECPECPVCTAWDARIREVEGRIDQLMGRDVAA